jgi:hypothetical protein
LSILAPGTAAAVGRRLTPEPEREPITDPVRWVRETLDEHPWSVQREVMRGVVEHRRVAVPSCHGAGKSYMASRIAAWWIDSHPVGDAFVVSSAPTGHQVKSIVWREVNRAHYRGGLKGRITGLSGNGAVEWHIGEELVGFGRKPQDLTDPNKAMQAFQGIHAPHVLVVLDEATGVPDWLWQAALTLLTNANARILAIGNPDDPSSYFCDTALQPDSGWWVRHISAFECPNLTGEAVPEVVREGTVSRQWVEDAERDYGGTDNPLYQSKVLGQVPDTSDDLVVTPKMIREAWARDLPGMARGAYGADIARSPSGDESTLYRNRGGVVRYVDSWRGLPITAAAGAASTVDRIYGHVSKTPNVPVVVDADGLGAGAYDGLLALEVRAVPYSAAGPARRPDRFDSRRSELWWQFRGRMADGSIDLDPADVVLAAQLQTLKWDLRGGRIHVETKKELAKRGKKSPDRADGAIMAVIGEPMNLEPEDPRRAEAERQARDRSEIARRAPETRAKRGEGAALRNRPM